MGIAYLLARAADTLADLPAVSLPSRLTALDHFRLRLQGENRRLFEYLEEGCRTTDAASGEIILLHNLSDCFRRYDALGDSDREKVSRLLMTLTHGMITDLTVFHEENRQLVVALKTRRDLESYTYSVAGCVGEFWTEMLMAHCPSCSHWNLETMTQKGVRFGQGLQMTNILRDLSHDLRLGRCYLPASDLAALGLQPEELLNPVAMNRLRPLLRDLLSVTLDFYGEGWDYLQAIPRLEPRLRLACCWPLFIGLKTIERLARSDNFLDPAVPVKISRRAVYGLLAKTSLLIFSRYGLGLYYHNLVSQIEKHIQYQLW